MNRRRKRLFSTVAIIILILGTIALLIGGIISGWNFIAWLSSTDAMWVYILVGIFLLATITVLIIGWVSK